MNFNLHFLFWLCAKGKPVAEAEVPTLWQCTEENVILIDCKLQSLFLQTMKFLKWTVKLTKTPPPPFFILGPLRLNLTDFDKFNQSGPKKLR